MDQQDSGAVHGAFEAILSARPEPRLPSLTDAAVAGGRRIRRRRAAVAAAGALMIVAFGVTTAVSVSGAGPERVRQPLAPPTGRPATTHVPDPVTSAETAAPSARNPDRVPSAK